MRRMRLLLLGKDINIVIDKPSVEIEQNQDEDEDMLRWEHALDQLPGEEPVYVATQRITEELVITTIDIDTGLEDIEEIELTPQEEYDRKISCSYQVCLSFAAFWI
jgi:hypothetical protein